MNVERVLIDNPAGTEPAKKTGRDQALDLLRVVAIGRVLLWHLYAQTWLTWFAAIPLMFFVAGTLLASNGSYWLFLRRRLKRLLLPLWFYGAVIAMVSLAFAADIHQTTRAGILNALEWDVPVVDPNDAAWSGGWMSSHLWYLRAYLWIIVAAPLLVWAAGRISRAFLSISLGVLAFEMASRTGILQGQLRVILGDFLVYGFFAMLGIAYSQHRLISSIRTRSIVAIGAGVAAVGYGAVFGLPIGGVNASYPAIALTGIAWLAAIGAAEGPIRKLSEVPRVAAITRRVSRRSLTIYLWHPACILFAVWLIPGKSILKGVAQLTVTVGGIVLAIAVVGWVETLATNGIPADQKRSKRFWSNSSRSVGAGAVLATLMVGAVIPALGQAIAASPSASKLMRVRSIEVDIPAPSARAALNDAAFAAPSRIPVTVAVATNAATDSILGAKRFVPSRGSAVTKSALSQVEPTLKPAVTTFTANPLSSPDSTRATRKLKTPTTASSVVSVPKPPILIPGNAYADPTTSTGAGNAGATKDTAQIALPIPAPAIAPMDSPKAPTPKVRVAKAAIATTSKAGRSASTKLGVTLLPLKAVPKAAAASTSTVPRGEAQTAAPQRVESDNAQVANAGGDTVTMNPTVSSLTGTKGITLVPAKLQKALDAWRSQIQPTVSSMIVSVRSGGGVWTSQSTATGFAPKYQVTVPFLAASITKTFTAALVLREVVKGSLKLDEQVPTLSGLMVPIPSGITVRKLMTHTAGLVDYTSAQGYDASRNLSPLDAVTLSFSTPLKGVGTVQYANSNYLYLGLLVQQIEGKPYSQLVDDMVKPIGLKSTAVTDQTRPGWIGFSSGGIVSTAADLTAWGQALFSTNRILDLEGQALLTTVGEANLGLGAWPACPCSTDPQGVKHYTAIGHHTADGGLFYFPTTGATVLAMFEPTGDDTHTRIVSLANTLIAALGG
jgi:CubicO group peptidase (beta-lactamase class C family)/peptidoglycan/LPS O-acetylase OafA/YrhL